MEFLSNYTRIIKDDEKHLEDVLRNTNPVRIIPHIDGCPMVKEGERNELVEHLGTFAEVQCVKKTDR